MTDHTDQRPEVTAWIANAMPEGTDTPCRHYFGEQRKFCGATPTRVYIPGRRCYDHRLDKPA